VERLRSDGAVLSLPVVVRVVRDLGHWVDQRFGRGAYQRLRAWLYPELEWSEETYARLVGALLEEDRRWLDAGCGRRILKKPSAAQDLSLLAKARSAVGCDLDLASLREHRSLRSRVGCNLARLPFPASSFDVITLNMVAEHFEDPAPVFHELSRVLAPQGCLVIHTPNASSYFVWLARLATAILPGRVVTGLIRYLEHREPEDVFPAYYRANTTKDLSRLLAEADLVPVRIRLSVNRPFFYFIAPLCALELVVTRILARFHTRRLVANTILAVAGKAHFAPENSSESAGRSRVEAKESFR